MIDVQEKKKKILEFLEIHGPSLPVQVARAIQMDPVFASAILSELIGSKQIKTSHMKIGASPLYLIPGQEKKLEKKTEHLKSIEKETQEKLKKERIITDEKEEPATRVALRNIKDFAIPFRFQDKITWKYAFAPQEEIDKKLFPKKEEETQLKEEIIEEEEREIKEENGENKNANTEHQIPSPEEEEVPKAWEVKKEEIKQAKEDSKKIESIFEEKEKTTNKRPISEQQATNKQKSPQTFLEEIEKFLEIKNTSIKTIEEVDKKKVIAIVESNEESSMLFAFNKLRINETELLKCYKEANKKNLSYQIIIKGDLTKKLSDTISAHQKLLEVNKLEN